MKASELIKHLQVIIDEQGDLPINVWDKDRSGEWRMLTAHQMRFGFLRRGNGLPQMGWVIEVEGVKERD